MKYIYAVIVIMIVFSGLAAFGLFNTRIEISEPFLSVNDRVISEKEFEKMLHRKPSYMDQDQFIESVIDKQLMIQEAIRMEINKEEDFRSAVESFYEQSLVKTLIDRKMDDLAVAVSDDEIAEYEQFMQNRVVLTKMTYPTLKDVQDKTNETAQRLESDFINLSDDLKFLVLTLDKRGVSKPKAKGMEGFVVYRLDDVQEKKEPGTDQIQEFDLKRISMLIQNQKKEQLLDEWTDKIRESAKIWRKK